MPRWGSSCTFPCECSRFACSPQFDGCNKVQGMYNARRSDAVCFLEDLGVPTTLVLQVCFHRALVPLRASVLV